MRRNDPGKAPEPDDSAGNRGPDEDTTMTQIETDELTQVAGGTTAQQELEEFLQRVEREFRGVMYPDSDPHIF